MTPPSGLPLVLASSSPRRRQLLTKVGISFEAIPAEIEEQTRPGELPGAMASRLACEKALAVARRLGPHPARWILGADTIVVLGERVLGKPASRSHAEEILGHLVGRSHRVLTGLALVPSDSLEVWTELVESQVRMRAASPGEIREYVATGEPLDKAGAYAVQGLGRSFVSEILGSESNVIGLPLDETVSLIEQAGGPWG